MAASAMYLGSAESNATSNVSSRYSAVKYYTHQLHANLMCHELHSIVTYDITYEDLD